MSYGNTRDDIAQMLAQVLVEESASVLGDKARAFQAGGRVPQALTAWWPTIADAECDGDEMVFAKTSVALGFLGETLPAALDAQFFFMWLLGSEARAYFDALVAHVDAAEVAAP